MGECKTIEVDFKKKVVSEEEATMVTDMVCLGCKHEHTAIVPLGVSTVECPECHLLRAIPVLNVHGWHNGQHWECSCTNRYFVISKAENDLPADIMCAACGKIQIW